MAPRTDRRLRRGPEPAVDKAGDLFWTQTNNGNQIWELPSRG